MSRLDDLYKGGVVRNVRNVNNVIIYGFAPVEGPYGLPVVAMW